MSGATWTSTESAWPLRGIKVLAWWPNWDGIYSVIHFDGASWINGRNAQLGRKVMRPTHWCFLPDPPETAA
jgi:hypothetical protein